MKRKTTAPVRKSDVVRQMVKEGKYKSALSIASNFKLGITQEDHDAMKRGYEAMTFPAFFTSIGIDPAEASKLAVETVVKLYGQS